MQYLYNIQIVSQLFMLTIVFLVNSTILVGRALGSQKLHKGFNCMGVLGPLTPAFLKGQLYIEQAQMPK